jgi:hypothetical protein
MKFKNYLKGLAEETTSADIATVDNKLDMVRRYEKHALKGKKCKKHKRVNCPVCAAEMEESWDN